MYNEEIVVPPPTAVIVTVFEEGLYSNTHWVPLVGEPTNVGDPNHCAPLSFAEV